MRYSWRSSKLCLAVGLTMALLGGGGCSQPAPQTYPVKGKVNVSGKDARQLAGGHVEVVQAGDQTVQAIGEIQEDGSFSLETIHAGKTLSGAQKGEYQARIVLSDEDRGNRLRRGLPVPHRFSKFKTSGLSIVVPPSGEVVLKVSPR